MQFNPEQIWWISVIASVCAWLARLVCNKFGWTFNRKTATAVIFAVGMLLAFFWYKPILPVWPVFVGEPAADAIAVIGFLAAFVASIAAVVGAAMPLYNLLLERFFSYLEIKFSQVLEIILSKPPKAG